MQRPAKAGWDKAHCNLHRLTHYVMMSEDRSSVMPKNHPSMVSMALPSCVVLEMDARQVGYYITCSREPREPRQHLCYHS